MAVSEPFLVSACLAGLCTDWRGRASPVAPLREAVLTGRAIPVCPEQLGGLPTPRVPLERRGERVLNAAGRDMTEPMHLGAERTLQIARRHGCRMAVLKARSPSCGSGEIHDGTFAGRLIPGDGVTAELLRREGLRVVTEDEYITERPGGA